VTMTGAMIGRLPGLLTSPSDAAWITERLAWLPVFAATLAVAWLLFHRFERRAAPRRPAAPLAAGPPAAGSPAPAGQPSAVFSRSSSPSCSSHSASGR
jgi:peptidoglycan/LPS O-acetylase OafA/YrhL